MEDKQTVAHICGTPLSKGDEIQIVYKYRKECGLALLVRPATVADLEEFVIDDLFIRDFVYHLAVHRPGENRSPEKRLLMSVCNANTLTLSDVLQMPAHSTEVSVVGSTQTSVALEQDLKALLGDFSQVDQSCADTILLPNSFVFTGV